MIDFVRDDNALQVARFMRRHRFMRRVNLCFSVLNFASMSVAAFSCAAACWALFVWRRLRKDRA